jgi:hypothetical protein
MCDEPISYDLARPLVAHISIYKQTSELPKDGPVLAGCTTNLKLDKSEGLSDLTLAITKSKDALRVNFEGMNEKVKAIYAIVDPVLTNLELL